MSKSITFTLTSCLLFFVLCLPIAAQSTNATLSGVVEDARGAVVPGVKITVSNPDTGLERTVTTGSDGSFVIPLLPPATYTVEASANGFKRLQYPNVALNVNDQRSMRIRLEVGDVAGVVEVRPDESLIEQGPGVSTTVDRTFVGNLPLSGRSLQSLIVMTPGVVPTQSSGQSPGEFSVNGQRSNANYFTVDGVSANVAPTSSTINSTTTAGNAFAGMLPGLAANGSTSALISVDALEEFKIQTSTYSAEFGRQPGGQVQLVSRAGSNEFHGTLFEYIRNEAFDARNYFNPKPAPEPPTRLNQFGGTFSGPVYLPQFGDGGKQLYNGKNRTFFFFSYEGQRLQLPNFVINTVPSLRLREIAHPVFQPILNAFPLPTGPELLVTCNPTTPGCSPNGTRPSGLSPFSNPYSDPRSLDATSIRIDQKFGEKHSLFGRFHYAPSRSLNRNLAELNGSEFKSTTFTFGLASLLDKGLTNDLRINYTQGKGSAVGSLDTFGGATPTEASSLLSGYPGPFERIQGTFSISSLAGSTNISSGDSTQNEQRQFNLVNNLSWTVGVHTLRLGIDFRRLMPIYGPFGYRQNTSAILLSFTGETRLVNGIVFQTGIDSLGSEIRPRFDNYSFYVQDAWKASNRLTFDLGLRWEVNPTPSEASGRNPVFVAGAENLATARLLNQDERWYTTDYTAFAPRAGAAYLLDQRPGKETVIRGGLGVFYDLNSGQTLQAYTGFPFILSKTVGLNVQWPLTPAQASLPAQPVVALPITQSLNAINEKLKLPVTLQWNLSMERQLGTSQSISIGYVAAAGRRLTTRQLLNQRTGDGSGPRPNPNFADINYIENGPSSDYHSMQTQYQRRLSKGLQAVVNYTWSHAIDEVSNEVEQGSFTRGDASFDVRHNFTGALTYTFPRLRRHPFADLLFRNWSIDAIALAYSGQPIDIFVAGSFVRSDGTFVKVRPDLVPGVPFWVADGAVAGGKKINLAAFALPPLVEDTSDRFTREGTLGRNIVRLPGIHQVNFALRREFNFSEKLKLQLRAEGFNLFNTPMLSGYDTRFEPESTFFGVATSTLNGNSALGGSGSGLNSLYALGGPRSMQFSARLTF